MSEGTRVPEPLAGAGAEGVVPAAPLAQGASALPVVRLTAEEDTYWIRHLGLPFFYRHTPPKWVLRVGFYLGFLVVVGLLVLNLAVIPYMTETFTADSPALLSQFFVLAIVISCILAPLFSTFSLASERATGTMEFLRLAPLSPTAIVLGKTFAPVYLLHLISAGLLLVGFLAGTVGIFRSWTTLGDLCTGVLMVFLTAVLMHALGAVLASSTTFLRGFAAVLGLLGFGFLVHFVPLTVAYEQGMNVLSYFSPWGMMESLFWHTLSRRGSNGTARIFDREAWAVPYLVFMHLSLSALLFRAAARRLDSPLRTALSPLGHISLWALLLITCLGVGMNGFRWGGAAAGWQAAAVMMGLLGTILIGFLIFDQPHRRETVLATACERISTGKAPPGSLWHLGHASLVALLTALGAAVLMFFVAFASPLRVSDWSWVVLVVAIPPVLAVLCCLVLEANQVGLKSTAMRGVASIFGIALLTALVLAAVIDVAYTLSTWDECVNSASNRVSMANRNRRDRDNYWQSRYDDLIRRYPERAQYLETTERISEVREALHEGPILFFVVHHPLACLVHLGLFSTFTCGVVIWRWRAYRGIRREAEQAVRASSPPSALQAAG